MELSTGTRVSVAPPVVTRPLKIIANVEDPYRRAKDLQDIRFILSRYEAGVIGSTRTRYLMANAFMLEYDLRTLVTAEDDRRLRGSPGK
jgi:hypothetical protein